MAAVLGDFLQITVLGRIFSQDVLNVYYYRVVSVTGFTNEGYETILDEFEETVITPVLAATSADYDVQEITVRNVTNGLDFLVHTFAVGALEGTSASPALPSYVNYTFRLQRESLVTRNGYKRFTGVPEDLVTGNTFVGSSALTTAIENGLKADLVSGVATLAEPVIMKRPLPTLVPSSHPYASIGGCDFRGIGSQNTRKAGSWE